MNSAPLNVDTSEMTEREVWALFLKLPQAEKEEYWRRWHSLRENKYKPRPLGRMYLEQFESDFWSRVSIGAPDECWEWKAPTTTYPGYNIRAKKRCYRANRIAYALFYGYCPPLDICHHCDNIRCVNPHHLFAGSDQDNTEDKIAKGRHAHGETHGNAKLTDAMVLEIRASNKPARELAARYGVGEQAVSCARRGKTWKHITT